MKRSPYNKVIEAAADCAREFNSEFPGEVLELGCDWDAAAWAEVRISLKLSDHESKVMWPIFHEDLHAAIRLAAEVDGGLK